MNNKEKKTHSMKARGMISDVVVHVVLALLAIVWVIPVLWIALLSFSTQKGSYVTSFFPKGYTLHNYVRLFTDTQVLDFPQMFKNTFIIAVFSCLISTIFVLSVSYCMSRMRFKIRKTYMNIAMILGLFPAFMSMVAVYYILKAVGLSEGSMIRVALILVYSGGSGAGFLLAKGFFDTVPKALDEAAYLDGATRFQVFTKVTIPLSKPIIVYTTLSAFLGPWLDFIFAKVICRANAKYYTVALGLWKMLEKEYIDSWYTCFAAGAVCISVPIAILFVVMQRYYTDGLSGATTPEPDPGVGGREEWSGSARRADRREIVVCGRGECVGGRGEGLDSPGGRIGVSLLTGAKFGDRMKKIFSEFFVLDFMRTEKFREDIV